MQCRRRGMARFDLSGRWRSGQGGMVLSAGLANPWVPPHARPQTLPANASHAGQASTGRMIKTGGPQWLASIWVPLHCLPVFYKKKICPDE